MSTAARRRIGKELVPRMEAPGLAFEQQLEIAE
jgi:hypothetical protein